MAHDLEQIADQIVILNGVTRSGTTITGKLCATLQNVEYEFEPWFVVHLPVIACEGLMEPETARKWMQKYVNELTITRLLGRSVNMRQTDDSRILNTISEEELHYRWNQLSDRKDAIAYAQRRKSILMMKITNFHSYQEFFLTSLKRCKIIHIVRNGLDVALSIMKKNWYGENRLRSPEYFNLSKTVKDEKTGREYTVPFHIPAAEARNFHEATPFGKALLAWCVLMEKNEAGKSGQPFAHSLEIKFEDLFRDPEGTVSRLCSFIGTKPTLLTDKILKTLKREKLEQVRNYPLHEVDSSLLRRASAMMQKYQYPAPLAEIPAP